MSSNTIQNPFSSGEHLVVRQTWPCDDSWTVNEGAERLGLTADVSNLQQDWERLRLLKEAPVPLVGVIGLLNSGKSSFVRSLLSEVGAVRVLVGEDEMQGTQRFVFWLPQRWKNHAEIFEVLKHLLATVFEKECELLEDDSAKAQNQYNGGGCIAEAFGVPLVAFDPRLDELGFGLVDCPDFERRHPGGKGHQTAHIRREFVSKAAQLMSAVVIVVERSKIATESIESFAAEVLGRQRVRPFLAINKVRPSAGVDALKDDNAVRHMMDVLRAECVFAAYDFEMDKAQEVVPAVALEDGRGLNKPVFFEVSSSPSENLSLVVKAERLIQKQLSKLEPAALWADQRKSCAGQLVDSLRKFRGGLGAALELQKNRLATTRVGLLRFVRDILAPDNTLKFPLTPEVSKQIADAVLASAPWWAMPTVWANSAVKWAVETAAWVGKSISAMMNPGQTISGQVQGLRTKLDPLRAESTIDANNLAERSKRQNFMPPNVDNGSLHQAWQKVLDSVTAIKVRLPDHEVKKFTDDIWNSVSRWDAFVLASSGPLTLVVGLGISLFDATGGSLTVTLTEFLLTLGLGALANQVSCATLERVIVSSHSVPSYIQMLKASLDVFHLPREIDGTVVDRFENTGELSLSLARDENEATAEPVVPLVENAFLGTEIQESWDKIEGKVNEMGAAT